VEVILTSVAVVAVVVVVVVVRIISMRVVVAVGEGGDYLDTNSSRSSGRSKSIGGSPARSLSCGQLTVL
jgi:hypothetical protein